MGQYLERQTRMARLGALLLVLVLVGTISGCARGKSVNPLIPTPTTEASALAPTASPALARKACQDGTMHIGDIPAIDSMWRAKLDGPNGESLDWHGDAQLVQLRVSCALFGSGFRLQPSYFSAQAQAILAEDTRESQPVNLDPDHVESLPLDAISFRQIYDALKEADFTDDLPLDPSTGIDIRISSEQAPFGPGEVPQGALIAHLSVSQSGQIKDLFVDMQTGVVYTYDSPA